jgi:cobalt-zinc-cadmium efflux system membrane fusion protein
MIVFAAVLAAGAIGFLAGRRAAPPAAAEESSHGEPSSGAGELAIEAGMQREFGMRFARAEVRALGRTIQATGSVQANESRTARIRPLARGRIDTVNVRPGDRVRAGQPLLTYDNVELGEAVGEYLAALAELRKALAETEVARRALERARSLVALGAVAEAELLRREAEHNNALATAEGRKAGAAKTEEKLHRFGLTDDEIATFEPDRGREYHRERSLSELAAPFDGVITAFDAAPGEAVGTEDELMTVADLATVWVQADVYEKDIHSVREGRPAEVVAAAYPDRVFTGVITYLSDVLDPNTRTAKVRVEVANPESLLKLGMFATVRILLPSSRPALSVPAAAVQTIEGRAAVFVRTGDDRFERRFIRPGERYGDLMEVVEGVEDGDTVVTEGSFLLKSELRRGELGHHEE